MTTRLQQAFAEAQKLPPEAQDALAMRILADLRDEQAWDESFKRTTDEQWDRLADEVRSEVQSGDIQALRIFSSEIARYACVSQSI